MQVSNQTNNYQMMQQYQQPIIQPVKPGGPEDSKALNNSEIYDASQGNLIGSEDGGVELTPQGQNNVSIKQEENAAQDQADAQATKDAQRGYATDYLAHKSKQSQVEIYLAVATDGQVSLSNDDKTPSIIESLRDVQKQNNAVDAYATYQENQNAGKPALY